MSDNQEAHRHTTEVVVGLPTVRVYEAGVPGGMLIDAAAYDPELHDLYEPMMDAADPAAKSDTAKG